MALLEDLKAINDIFNAAIESGDVNAAVALFTEDAICIASDTPMVCGLAAVADFLQSWVDAGTSNLRDKDHVAEGFGDVAYLTCTYACDYRQDDGSVTSEQGKALQVFKRDGSGTWKIHRFGSTADIAQ